MLERADVKRFAPLSLYGLAFVWSPMYGASEATIFASLGALSSEMTLSRVIGLLALTLGMLAFSIAGEKLKPLVQHGPVALAAVAFGVIGMLLGGLVGLSVLPTWYLYIGAFCRGSFMAFITVAWLEVLIRVDNTQIGTFVALSLATYAISGLVLVFSAAIAPAITVLLLMACPVLCYHGYLILNDRVEVLNPVEQETATAPLSTRAMLYAANLLFGIMLGVVLHYFAMKIAPGHIAAFLVMALVMSAAFALPSGRHDLHEVYRIFMMAFAIAVSLLALTGFLEGDIATTVASIALAVIILYTIIIFTDTQARFRKPFWRVPGMCQVFAAIGMIISSLVLEYMITLDKLNPVSLVLLTAACVVFVAGAFSPSERLKTRPWGFSSLIPAESPELRRLRHCGELADQQKLTPRELEILQLLAIGATKEDVAQTLWISPATAKTHIRNIYGKLGVHSQQELASLIERD
ncbi:MAG: helix-turn-helix transcriptional regulator [Eggerthellaceae bacterium]|nr:helix-turn-helix transcriptional regulator [Eggerthellaceae bacterium]